MPLTPPCKMILRGFRWWEAVHCALLHRRPEMATVNSLQSKKSPPTKAAAVCKLLSRARGATVEEIMTATSWQNHSVRAFFTGLRKRGHTLVREERTSGQPAYRLMEDEDRLNGNAIERGTRGTANADTIATS